MSVEICLFDYSLETHESISTHVTPFIARKNDYIFVNEKWRQNAYLANHVKHITACQSVVSLLHRENKNKNLAPFFIFKFDEPIVDASDASEYQENDNDDDVALYHKINLPSEAFHGEWEMLDFESDVKNDLLRYVMVALELSKMQVNSKLVSFNRVLLLHGEPGTGKTSLCRALSQKLSIRGYFPRTQFIEINAHALFSKYFSESGKLVARLFASIDLLLEENDTLLCVLIDEVESLTAARSAAMNGVEPSDSIRVVNALLTQLDRIKRHANVLILSTSNITGAIDGAFLDRADIKIHVPLPGHRSRYRILVSALDELGLKNVIAEYRPFLPFEAANDNQSKLLRALAKAAEGLSARTLRKLPFLALVLAAEASPTKNTMQFLYALQKTIEKSK